MDGASVAAIISALGAIVATVLNFYSKLTEKQREKALEYKYDRLRTYDNQIQKSIAKDVGVIYGELHKVLWSLNCDRVYIVQPHPLTRYMYVTITLEVKKSGVEAMKPAVVNLDVSEVALFIADLSQRDFLHYNNIAEQVKDCKARALLGLHGTETVFIKKMNDTTHDWVGSIFCEYQSFQKVDFIAVKALLNETATKIQYILPPVEDEN